MSTAEEEATDSGFRITSRRQVYKRYLQVEDRQVVYPDGRQAAFDIVGHKHFDTCFVSVFVYHNASNSVTMLREFAQAALPQADMLYGLPSGGYDPDKHSSLLHAAQCELSEEVQLCGGSWVHLLPEEHPGVLESKWCRNRFNCYLCIDPEPDPKPRALDYEEHIEVLREVPVMEAWRAALSGNMMLSSVQCCLLALNHLGVLSLADSHVTATSCS